jgi:ribosomal protein S18 acetylase RimI-like enzyme
MQDIDGTTLSIPLEADRMTSNFHTRQGLFRKRVLAKQDIEEIRSLAELCDQHEQLHMRISWSALSSREGDEVCDMLYYLDGHLVGYMVLDGVGEGSECEITGMVHPAYRRRGIFTTLLRAAQEDCARHSIPHAILVCERSSVSGQAFVQSVGAFLELSEHEMWLTNFQERGMFDDRLSFKQATLEDLDALVKVQAESFGVPEILSRQSIVHRLKEPACRVFLARFGGSEVECGESVGLLRLQDEGGSVGIYGFGVMPDYQGRGYGRQMLEEAIRLVRSEGDSPIMLDVETTNERALGLYLSCGFEIKTTYDYSHVATS